MAWHGMGVGLDAVRGHLREPFEVRMALEGRLQGAVERGDAAGELNRCNRAFHERIYAGCNNGRLLELLKNLWDPSSRYPAPLTGNDPSTWASIQEHDAILDALSARDAALAERLTLDYKARSMDRIVKRVEQREGPVPPS